MKITCSKGLLLLCALAFASTLTETRTASGQDISAEVVKKWTNRAIWPNIPPGEKGPLKPDDVQVRYGQRRVYECTRPAIDIYPPAKGKSKKTCIVLVPGGGYGFLVLPTGKDTKPFQDAGITVFFLRYRVPKYLEPIDWLASVQDAQRTVSLLRANANELQIDPNKIGILGASAGAQTTIRVAANGKRRSYQPVDDADKAPCNVNFGVPISSWEVIGYKTQKLLDNVGIDKDTAPLCMFHGDGDHISSLNTIKVYLRLKELRIPTEIHIYVKSTHGLGVDGKNVGAVHWRQRAIEWMQTMGWL